MPKRAGSSSIRPGKHSPGSSPRTFWLHFNRINVQRGEPDIWTVHLSDQCIQTKKVICTTPIETVYRGQKAQQPRAYFKGVGIVDVFDDHVVIS